MSVIISFIGLEEKILMLLRIIGLMFILGVVIVAAMGYLLWESIEADENPGNTLSMSWFQDAGKHYGVFVYLKYGTEETAVHALVYTDRKMERWHDCGELGKVKNYSQAIDRWGKIIWTKDGLLIGTGKPYEFFIAQNRIIANRQKDKQ